MGLPITAKISILLKVYNDFAEFSKKYYPIPIKKSYNINISKDRIIKQ